MEIQNIRKTSTGFNINGVLEVKNGDEFYNLALEWEQSGKEVMPIFTNNELLSMAKESKKKELETAFETASKLPVAVGAKTYNGGKESAQAIRDYIDLVTESDGTEYTIWDTSNDISTYALAQANAIKLAVAQSVAQCEFNLRTKKNEVEAATTIEAVNVVVW